MTDRSTIPSPVHAVGEELHGFRIEAVTPIPDIKALAYEATHLKTGAQLLHVHCYDNENLFSVGFRTPPPDSTGVAHILEHCVLAGSEQFPVKDAFNELGKRTLNTFLNAMTWPDRTVYPVCSPVKADYFNLARVYADLVFHPLITKQTFQREGHHLEVVEPEAEGQAAGLTVSGVVFNEMKGVYGSPENYFFRTLNQHLLPDTPYGVDSGGDPAVIPDLTYENFVAFHRRFYSPSNARFLLYGDVTLAENLSFLENILSPFDRVEVDSALPLQPAWSAPKRATFPYPISPDEPREGKSYVVVSWLLGETSDVRETLKLEIAFFALAGSAAGPMRKALIDSGLGKDLFPSGAFDADARQAQAAIGLRGTDADKADAIEALILSTLEKIVAEGLDAELIDAAFHHVSFHTREITPPFPLMILYRVNPPWYFGADPKAGLAIGQMLEELRAEYAANPGIFAQALKRWLLDNPHRLTAVATPDPELVKQWEAEFAARMEALRATLDDAQVAQIKAEAEALKAEQDEPDTEEALATLPSLALEEIPRRVLGIPTQVNEEGGVEVLAHPVFSNGIAYVGLSFDTVDLSDEEAALLPFLGKATTELGAAGLSYERMARRIARHTGGLSASPLTGRHLGTGARFERLTLDAKLLPHDADAVMGILRDVLLASDTSEHKRLKDLVLESASRSRARLQPSGHAFAYTRAAATLDAACWRTEQWSGVTQLKLLTELAKEAEGAEAVARLGARLKALQQKIFVRARAQASLAGDPALVEALRPKLNALLAQLPQGEAAGPDLARVPEGLSQHTGVLIGGQMHYVAQVVPVPNYASPAAPALELMAQVLSNDLLYNKLRVQGGAYGGFSFYLSDLGLLPLVSYRDPNLAQTLQVYASVADYVRSEVFSDEAIHASRIGTIGSFDKILSPAQMLGTARKRRFMGLGDEQRAAFRDGLFSVGAQDVRRLALPHIEAGLASAPSAALAPRASLEAANPTLAHPLALFSLD